MSNDVIRFKVNDPDIVAKKVGRYAMDVITSYFHYAIHHLNTYGIDFKGTVDQNSIERFQDVKVSDLTDKQKFDLIIKWIGTDRTDLTDFDIDQQLLEMFETQKIIDEFLKRVSEDKIKIDMNFSCRWPHTDEEDL